MFWTEAVENIETRAAHRVQYLSSQVWCIMLYAFFWVIPRRLKFICRRFGTLCLFHLHPKESIQHSVHGESLKSR